MVKAIFKNNEFQKQFEEDGFLKITLLTPENILQLKNLFKAYYPNPSVDFYSSSYDNDFEIKKKISDKIGQLILPNLENIFIDYTWFGSAFLSKGNGPRSEMPMHQDWTIVDETQFVALNIWTPLQDTNDENGTLEVIKGSHKWHSELRAPTLPFYFNGYQEKLKSKLISIPTKATEAIVLNQSVIHYSKPNKTNEIRLAITTGIKSKGAPMIFHYWNKDEPNEIEQFEQEDDFLLQFTDFHQDIFNRPQIGKSIGKKSFQLNLMTESEVEKLIKPEKIKRIADGEKSFFKKMKQWIKS